MHQELRFHVLVDPRPLVLVAVDPVLSTVSLSLSLDIACLVIGLEKKEKKRIMEPD
jgi:hypothetical protein